MPLQLEDLELLAPSPEGSGGQPLAIPVDLIDEDPGQPRTEFDPISLQELADSIAQRGVLQAISVRPHPEARGRWMLNFGARRLRASRLAQRPTIRAYVDEKADSYDQVIENEQREALRPIELALFIERELVSGRTQAEVARRLGKSRPYVSYVCSLIDAPDWLMNLYREGRCRGIRELYDLRRLHGTRPEKVQRWLGGHTFISRADVEALREHLGERGDAPGAGPSREPRPSSVAVLAGREFESGSPAGGSAITPTDPPPLAAKEPAKPRGGVYVLAQCGGRSVRIVTDRCPTPKDQVFVRPLDGRGEFTAELGSLREMRLTRSADLPESQGGGRPA